MAKMLQKSVLKVLIPIIVLLVLVSTFLFSFFPQESQFARDLARLQVGEMEKFELFEEPRPLPERFYLDTGGNSFALSDMNDGLLIVNFWATWCAPCRWEMPALDRLDQALEGTGAKVVIITMDRKGFEVADPFLSSIGVENLDSYWDQDLISLLDYGGTALPFTLLINKEGQWIGRALGPLEWDRPEVVTFMQRAASGE